VDGSVAPVVPVHAARATGADVVIAADTYCHRPGYKVSSIVSTVLRVTQSVTAGRKNPYCRLTCLLLDTPELVADGMVPSIINIWEKSHERLQHVSGAMDRTVSSRWVG